MSWSPCPDPTLGVASTVDAIETLIVPRAVDLGGMEVRRALPPRPGGRWSAHAYYDRLWPLLEEFDNLGLSIRNVSQTPRGRLRLAAPLTFGALELTPALNDFAARFPEIELDVSFSVR